MFKQDKVLIGLISGLIIPFVTYAIILTIYDFSESQRWIQAADPTTPFRARTQGLFAIAANLITINFFRKKRQDNSMRGVVIATAIYIILWVVFYGKSLVA